MSSKEFPECLFCPNPATKYYMKDDSLVFPTCDPHAYPAVDNRVTKYVSQVTHDDWLVYSVMMS